MKKNGILELETLAVYPICNWGGLEIKKIEYSIDDYIYFLDMAKKPHKAKIYSSNDRFYFNFGKTKIFLRDFINV